MHALAPNLAPFGLWKAALRLLFALPGFHRYHRGAEVALLAVATELARAGHEVDVAGSGVPPAGTPYGFVRIPSARREMFERFPTMPALRSDVAWEDMTFATSLLLKRRLGHYDATITCSFPFTHWALRFKGRGHSAHIFVTQNGDWPAFTDAAEFRTFRCDGLVCTNPDYFERNRARWRSALIPNGIDLDLFKPGPSSRSRIGIPADQPVVLMVSALIDSKRVLEGISAVAGLENAVLVVAGDGPTRQQVLEAAESMLPGRFRMLSLAAEDMPDLYRSADVFLHLSLQESFGNVFLEARASGLPIVAHDSARLRWILGDGQYLCDTTNPSDLQAALRAALAGGAKGERKGVERFSWRCVGRQYEDFIEAAVRKQESSTASGNR